MKRMLVSPEAKKVWSALSVRQRTRIDKFNPFREDRNEALRELKARGVKNIVLSEISGLTPVAICYILKGKTWRRRRKTAEG
jgi:hypothetical protein